jgi:hypothetical protein
MGAVRVGTASGVVWEKNAKVAVLCRSYKILYSAYREFLLLTILTSKEKTINF